jgi:catechol 2,3-dioxygenase-like lactoylglutathione lyase family enzyme
MTEVKGVNHITITVKDFDKNARFYDEVLRLPRLPRPDHLSQRRPGARYKVGDSRINVVQERTGDDEALRHVSLEAVDFDALVKDFQDRGVKLAGGPAVYPGGRKWIRLVDPEGNIIEIVSGDPK